MIFLVLLMSLIENSYQINFFRESNFENILFEGTILNSLILYNSSNKALINTSVGCFLVYLSLPHKYIC